MTMDTRQRAESLYAEGQWKEAERLFAGLMAEGQGDGNLLHDHAVCIFQLGRKKEALDELDRAVALEPDNPYRYSSRAWIRSALKDVDGAIADYRKALELDPDDAITLNNLGLLEEQYGMRKAAQERFRRADTLSGILRDAGVDPPTAAPEGTKPAGNPEASAAESPDSGSLWGEVMAVFTTPERRREFFRFLRNGWRP